jgi:uncharacterized protein (TIGR00297 family)
MNDVASAHLPHVPTLAIGVVLASAIAVVARRARALSTGGAIAAAAVGTVAMAAGWGWGILLIAYFASSVALTRFRSMEKEARSGGRVDKGGPRDTAQVIANGGVFAATALAYSLDPQPAWQALAAGALAASAADTWATEIGMLSRAVPRSILGWSPVDPGTSGGVTTQGLLAGAAGAGFVAAVVSVVGWPALAALSALAGGVVGCVVDSIIGAALQARRWCASCGTATEQRIHRCGTVTAVTGGIRWLDNDGVNALSTFFGALTGLAVASLS